MVDPKWTGPCAQCGSEAPYLGNDLDGRPEYFCCACNLQIMGEIDPDCRCGVCEAERLRAQIAIPNCDCEICTEWRARATSH
jgi:hypothetical protein